MNCTVTIDLGPSVMDSDLSLLMVDVRLFRDGTQLLDQTSSIMSSTTFTYSRRFDSFGRMDSGNYTCTAEVEPRSNIPYLTASEISQSATVKLTTGILQLHDDDNMIANNMEIFQTIGVYLFLNRRVHNNDTIIPIRNIGESSAGLQCITDKMSCCRRARLGQWFFPNHESVTYPFNVTWNADGAVILNRLSGTTLSPTGLAYCAIPDATGAEQRLYAHIG